MQFTLKRLNKKRSQLGSRSYAQTPHHYDVMVVGGGMAGASLACALGKAHSCKHLRIGVVDTIQPKKLHPLPTIPDLRVFSISHGSAQFLQAIGVWDEMIKARASPFQHMKVWDSRSDASLHFSYYETEEPELGWILEHHVIQGAIFESLHQCPNVDFILSDKSLKITLPENDLVHLQTSNGTYTARLLVGADGANSFVRETAGIVTKGKAYNEFGVVATVQLEEPCHTAYQRFLPSGPLALLPLYDNYSSVVWSTNQYQANHLKQMSNELFLESLKQAFTAPYKPPANVFGDIGQYIQGYFSPLKEKQPEIPKILSLVGQRAAFPLQTFHVDTYIKPRVALVGDAAHVVHPIAGQGINLGFSDVVALMNKIIYCIETGTDIGNYTTLEEYDRERKLNNLPMMAGFDSIHALFGTSFTPAVTARNLGLSFASQLPTLKKFFISQAAGRADLSKLRCE